MARLSPRPNRYGRIRPDEFTDSRDPREKRKVNRPKPAKPNKRKNSRRRQSR